MKKPQKIKIGELLRNLKKVYKILSVSDPIVVFEKFSGGKEALLIPAMQFVPAFDAGNKNLLLKYSLILANALTPYAENEDWYEVYLSLDKGDKPIYYDSRDPSCNSGHVCLDFYVIRSNLYSRVGKIISRFVKRATPKIVLPRSEDTSRYRLTGCFWVCTGKQTITLPTSAFLLKKNRKMQGVEYKDKLFNVPESLVELVLPDV